MKRVTGLTMLILVAFTSVLSIGSTGCDEHIVGEVAVLTGDYFGGVLATVSTAYLLDAWGGEAPAGGNGDDHDEHGHEEEEEEHSHDAGPLHDHEH